jgi:peptide/nickel transport system ATP-binding protein
MPEQQVPPLVVTDVVKTYPGRGRPKRPVIAVDHVSFTIAPGAAVGLVGASGSGKSTIAKMVTASERPSVGTIVFGDQHVETLGRRGRRNYHRLAQMIFQDPYGALNPLHTVEYAVMRPAQNYLHLSAKAARDRAHELLETVGLTPSSQYAPKLPHQLSGGQHQRVVIARSLACGPRLLVADEPVSMLDVSLRADILRLLVKLRQENGLSLLYITHDLLGARVATDQLIVLNEGKVVETGPTKRVLQHPQDPYTKELLAAMPNPFAHTATQVPLLEGELAAT